MTNHIQPFIPEVGAHFMATKIGGVTVGPFVRLEDEEGMKAVTCRLLDKEMDQSVWYLKPGTWFFMDAPSL